MSLSPSQKKRKSFDTVGDPAMNDHVNYNDDEEEITVDAADMDENTNGDADVCVNENGGNSVGKTKCLKCHRAARKGMCEIKYCNIRLGWRKRLAHFLDTGCCCVDVFL